ncbi:phytosulfokine receptor 1, partial [Genlisea aurea]
RVVSLELGGRRLSGSISESLGGLDHLRVLNLSRNSLQGSVSGLITHFPELVVLDLSMNSFSGTLAGGSLDLPAMEVFNVSGNKIAGAVPVGLCINSTRISVLDLGGNLFGGVLPPEIGNCVSLEMLDLATNFISGGLPESLFRLVNLKELYLQENRFSGELSGLIGGLSNLTHLDLSSNNFSGSIPDVFDRFFHLSYFSAQSNRLTGAIPPSLANSPTVSFLILRNNSLSGTIDLNCSAMVNLVSLNLATNQFHGDIPETLASCPLLRTINFARIDFSGQVPESFKNFQSLSSISLSNASISNLTGALEIFQHCRNLTTLVLTLNFRNEEMPSYQSLQFSELKILVIANCQITGVIPRWLSGCRNLQLLDLSMNRLSGAIPPWFGNLSSLFYLDVSDNMLSGEIPKELTEIQRLIDGNASMDGPSPDFPFFVRRNLTGFKYRHVLSFPSTLELANNSFTGNIWPEFGKLKELQVLDLKYNRLSGSIPSSLSEMRSLETLDLSFNNLAGRIPSSLTSLSFLSEFDVAYNNLSGPVPTGGQFSTFPNSSFVGNLALCGDHGLPPCPRLDKAPLSPPGKSEKRKGAVIAMGVGIGLGSSVLAGIAICLVMARACFSRGEQQKDDDDDLSRDPDVEEISSVAVLCQDKDAVTEICFDDLLKATDNFDQSNIIGCGGFGFVYKAVLPDGRKVAIKRLCGEHFQMEKEFHAEIETLSRAQHPNLVRLQGYCKYRDDRLLIYTFMENGSLDYWLHEKSDGPASLDWKTRLEIARGAARGLSYLHLRCEPRILHRDVKSSNILLGERFEARLADFGLARL